MTGMLLSDQLRAQAEAIRAGTAVDVLQTAAQLERAAQLIELNADIKEIRRFSGVMVSKMARVARHKGKYGWRSLSVETLSDMLREHVEKGDPVDVAIFAMMINHQMEASTA